MSEPRASPGNPTGSIYTREELKALSEVAAEEDIYILSDEIYEKLTYEGVPHISTASLPWRCRWANSPLA